MIYRYGNKQILAESIIRYFPKHDIYIEPFFGSGGLFFHKPKARYNIVNDRSQEVFNLFMVLKNQHEKFIDAYRNTPVDENLFNYWLENEEINPVNRAVRFAFLSTNRYLGYTSKFAVIANGQKKLILSDIEKINMLLDNVVIASRDFEVFIKKILFRRASEIQRSFIYADPPYVNTFNCYEDEWNEYDTIRLFDTLVRSNIRFAITEYDTDLVRLLIKDYKLKVIPLKKRKNGTEILIVNYSI